MTKATIKVGDIVELKDPSQRIQVLDFHNPKLRYYFEKGDRGEVVAINSPCVRERKGKPDTQNVIQFEKRGAPCILRVRVDTDDLVIL